MKTKPYPQTEEKPLMANEPTVAYQRTAPASYRRPSEKMNYTQEEINSILDKYKSEDPEWEEMSRPYSMEQINRWMDEGEAEDEEMMLTHEQVFAEFKRKYPWLS